MASRRATKRRRATTDVEQSAPVAPVVESGNTEPAPTEDSFAVFRWAGRGMYVGGLVNSRGIPRYGTVSLPPESFKRALADGLEFVRWAR